MKTDKNSVYIPINDLFEGRTYQTHTKDIVKITSIDKKEKVIVFRNISQVCNMRTDFKNVNLVKDKLVNIKHIYSTDKAFAALLKNGIVVTWGDEETGGDSSEVKDQMSDIGVETIYSTKYAFAALLKNGKVVTWGAA